MKSNLNLPVQLFEGNGDLEVVSQHMEGCEDVSPLHHLPQWTPLQHLGTEDIPRLLRQKAHVDEDLKAERKKVKSRRERAAVWFVKALLLLLPQHDSESNNRQFEPSTAETLYEQYFATARIHVWITSDNCRGSPVSNLK